MRITSGVTDKYVYFVAVDATDFATRETGLSSFTVYRARDGAASAAMTTPTINEVDATNMPGVYRLLADEDMTIGSGNDSEEMCFHVTHAGMAPVTRTIELYRPKITAGNTLGVAADGDISGNIDGAVGSVTAQVTADMTAISGDLVAADNLEAALDGTGGVTLSLDQLAINNTGAGANILLSGSGSGDGIAFSRSGAGDAYDANFKAAINAECDTAISDAALATSAQIGAAGAALTDLGGMSATMKAEVNTEVLDVLNTDTFAEPGQEAPGATVTLAQKIGYLYKAWRNKATQTSTTYSLFADDTTTVDQKATVSDDGTTATKAEVGTGP